MKIYEEPTDEQLKKLLEENKVDKFADEISKIYINEMCENNSESMECDLLEVDESGELHFQESGEESLPEISENQSDNRNHIITFRVNDEELKMINERFKKSGFKNRGQYCRDAAMTAFIFNENKDRMESIAKSVARIACSFNQIAFRLNRTENLYTQDIENMKKGIEEIWQLLTSIQSKREYVHQLNTSLTHLKPRTADWLLAVYVYLMHKEQASSSGKSGMESEKEKPSLMHST